MKISQTLIIANCLFLIGIAAGCASSRIVKRPSAPLDLGVSGKSNKLDVVVKSIVLPNGPGAWVKDGKWLEFNIEVTNRNEKDVQIALVRVVDSRGIYIDQSVGSPMELESQSASIIKSVGGSMVSSYALHKGVELAAKAAYATGSMLPISGFVGVADTMMGGGRASRAEKDYAIIVGEFSRRQFPIGVQMAQGGSLAGSAFFPLLPGIKTMTVDFLVDGKPQQLKIDMSKAWETIQSQRQMTASRK